MRYLTAEEMLVLHSEIIDATGGSHGVRDPGLLSSIAMKPQMAPGDKELYPAVFGKGAVYLESIATYHVFIDGNKRTAFAAAVRFLFLNKIEFRARNREIEGFMRGVVAKKYALEDIAVWLKQHSIKMR